MTRPPGARLVAIAPDVFVATSRREYTTSTAVVSTAGARRSTAGTRRALLVDPCWDPDELAGIGGDLARADIAVTVGLATHAHHDHLLWHPSLGDATRFASVETARRARHDRAGLLSDLGPGWPEELVGLFAQVEAVTGPLLPWDGPDVELIVHDAHIPGHTAAWIPALGLLIAGDMLSDIELPLPDTEQPRANQHAESPGATRDPLESYLEGLDRLGPYVNRANLVIPGHGTPTADGLARLDADRRYLDAVRAGRRCDDARIAHPGMDAAHRTTVALATGGC